MAVMQALKDPLGWWCTMERPLARLPRRGAVALLLGLAAALALAAATASAPPPPREHDDAQEATGESGPRKHGDLALYHRIADRVDAGEDYYIAATDEHRAASYPTIPFVTVRLPTLYWIHKLVGEKGLQILGWLVLLATVLAWERKLAPRTNLAERTFAAICLFMSATTVFTPHVLLMHDIPAGLLLSLAMGLYHRRVWWPALLVAGAAIFIREIAAPFVLLWLAFALAERRWREAGAIAALLVVFAVALFFHAQAVEAVRLPSDQHSPGWTGMLGVDWVLQSLSRLTPLLFLPPAWAAPLALLPLFGWLGLGGHTGAFAVLFFAGMGLAMALFARVENYYWVMLVLPVYAVGLALVPRALFETLIALRQKIGSSGEEAVPARSPAQPPDKV